MRLFNCKFPIVHDFFGTSIQLLSCCKLWMKDWWHSHGFDLSSSLCRYQFNNREYLFAVSFYVLLPLIYWYPRRGWPSWILNGKSYTSPIPPGQLKCLIHNMPGIDRMKQVPWLYRVFSIIRTSPYCNSRWFLNIILNTMYLLSCLKIKPTTFRTVEIHIFF